MDFQERNEDRVRGKDGDIRGYSMFALGAGINIGAVNSGLYNMLVPGSLLMIVGGVLETANYISSRERE